MKCPIEKCKAGCCGAVPIPKTTIAKYRHLIERGVTELEILGNREPNRDPIITEAHAVIFDSDIRCGFLGPDNHCMIYNFRPPVCVEFGRPEFIKCPEAEYVEEETAQASRSQEKQAQG